MSLCLGKRDARPPSSDHVPLKALLGGVSIPPIPEHFGHGYAFGDWLMLGNGPDSTVFPGFQGCGDCAWAGPAHETMEAARTSGRPIPRFSGSMIVNQYSQYSGYNPQTGENDNGSDVQEVLKWRQTKGLLDNSGAAWKIGKTVSLTPGDPHELWAAAYLFECVGIGVQLQSAQMDQTNAGMPWDYVKGSPVDGGHYVPVMGDNGLISWGRRMGFTRAFYENCNDESFAYVDPARYNAVTGKTAEGFDDQDLELYVSLVAKG